MPGGRLAADTHAVDDAWADLPLFAGLHVRAVAFGQALDRLDLEAAVPLAPGGWGEAVAALASAVAGRSPGRADLDCLVAARPPEGAPALIERTWQRLVGRCLDGHGIPGVLDGEPAATFLLRGREPERAEASVRRHLLRHPTDASGWAVLAHFDPVRGAARSAFHGGPLLSAVDDLAEQVDDDELEPVALWVLPYAWLARRLGLDDLRAALEAEGLAASPPLPIPGDPRAFSWYLLDAGGRPLSADQVGVPEARRRLKQISPAAFRRYLGRT